MAIGQVNFTGGIKTPQKPLSKGQKVAIGVGVTAAAVATTAAVASFAVGKRMAPDAKFVETMKEGFNTIVACAIDAYESSPVAKFFNGIKSKIKNAAHDVKSTVETRKIDYALHQSNKVGM